MFSPENGALRSVFNNTERKALNPATHSCCWNRVPRAPCLCCNCLTVFLEANRSLSAPAMRTSIMLPQNRQVTAHMAFLWWTILVEIHDSCILKLSHLSYRQSWYSLRLIKHSQFTPANNKNCRPAKIIFVLAKIDRRWEGPWRGNALGARDELNPSSCFKLPWSHLIRLL